MNEPVSLPPLSWAGTRCVSARNKPEVRLVVVHDPEGGYSGTVAYIRTKEPDSSGVSYHVLTDETCEHATQFVPWDQKAWSCVRFNSWSDNISIAGFAGNAWGYNALNRLARVVAFRLHERGLPAKFISAPVDPDNPPRGFTFHSELGSAGGSHHDPGLTGLKKGYFVWRVRWHLRYGKFRKSWGR